MDTKTLEIFKQVVDMNNKLIEMGYKITPMCFIIDKKGALSIIAMPFSNDKEKEKCRLVIMKMISLSDLKAYIFVSDTNMTLMDQTGKKENTVQEVCIRTLYSVDEIVRDWVIHDGSKIIGQFDTKSFDDPQAKFSDMWNFWGSPIELEDEEKMNKEYYEFKRTHRELYK